MRIGYVYSCLDERYVKAQIEELRNSGIKQIIVDSEEIDELRKGDELVVYELKSLGKSVAQLPSFFDYLEEKKVKLIILRKGEPFNDIPEHQYFEILTDLAETESFIISDRTTKGIRSARRSGRVGGRPRISKETIDKIKYLYHDQAFTLREISEKCDVSLGTAYKYIHK